MAKISEYPTITSLVGNELVLMDSGLPGNRTTVTATTNTLAEAIASGLGIFSATQSGSVPASGGGLGRTLRSDETWQLAFDPTTGTFGYYAQTTGEQSAGVTPTNFSYFPGDIRRYGGIGDGATNNYTAFQHALAVCKQNGLALIVPPGSFVIDTSSGTLDCSYVTIIGTGVTDGSATPSAAGSVLAIKGTANSPFTIGPGVTFNGVAFYYPDQVDSATPIVYPPTIVTSLAIAGAINFVYVQNCTVFNAYRFFVDTDTTGALGHVFFLDNTIYGILTCFEIAYNAEIVTFQGNEFTFGHFLAATEGGLRGYTRANGTVLQITRSDGIVFQANVLFGYLDGIHFNTSATLCQLTSILGNYFDQVRFGILVDGTGNISGLNVVANSFVSYNTQNTALSGNAIKVTTSGAIATETIAIANNNFSTCTADEIITSGTPVRALTITGNQFNTWAAFAAAGSFGGLNIGGSATSYVGSDNVFVGVGTAFASGILGSASSANIGGNTFLNCFNALNITCSNVVTTRNMSFSSGGTSSDVIAGTNIFQVDNLWDKASGTTTRPQLRVFKNASQTFSTGATGVVVTFAGTTYDKAGNWNSGTSTWTAKQAARYRFTWMLMHDNTATAGERWAFALTPSAGPTSVLSYVTIANFNCFTATAEFDLANGATVQLLVTQVNGTHGLVTNNDANSNYFTASIVE